MPSKTLVPGWMGIDDGAAGLGDLCGGRAKLDAAFSAPKVWPVLSAAVEVAVYRIVTEALTNIARHTARPTAVVTSALLAPADGCLTRSDLGST
jgi:signal transduction histidine kinase